MAPTARSLASHSPSLDEQAPEAGQFDDEFIRQSVGQEPLLLVPAHDAKGRTANDIARFSPAVGTRVGADCRLCRAISSRSR